LNRGTRICSPLRHHSATRPSVVIKASDGGRLERIERQCKRRYLKNASDLRKTDRRFRLVGNFRISRCPVIASGARLCRFSPPFGPPNAEPTTPATHDRHILGKNQKSQRNHPEAEYWKKAQEAAKKQRDPGRHAGNARPRKRDSDRAENHMAGAVIQAEGLRLSRTFCFVAG
jgi:hypothetical protein